MIIIKNSAFTSYVSPFTDIHMVIFGIFHYMHNDYLKKIVKTVDLSPNKFYSIKLHIIKPPKKTYKSHDTAVVNRERRI